ncbi:twin-arginine translocase TatA/TatE family subunit [Telmatospirillum sp.]|uniref:twin-arginine translocase TatA/TatE family subunit n=1 Tax=Telmatospirillum sp. TaxID=2079197 RepID=UPI002842697F|nr:twin-arginine translocase TatA/TatE family subunit [Telmatospirillum sp.]MDR3435994.1 twin-arginine translocase TatA/TatE family subunit [Telmatospirillum sp.]
MGSFSIWHWIIVLAIVLLLFGTGRVSNLMGDLAKGVKAFKKGLQEEEGETPSDQPKVLTADSAKTASTVEKDEAVKH